MRSIHGSSLSSTTGPSAAQRLALAALLALAGVAMILGARPAAAQSRQDQYGSEKPSGLMVEVAGTLERLDPGAHGYGEYLI